MENAYAERQGMEPVLLRDDDAIKCPVPVSQGKIYQCQNGHILCAGCTTNFTDKCPVCKIRLAGNMVRNRALEEFVGCTRIRCKYHSLEHFLSCEFRPFELWQKLFNAFSNCPYARSKVPEILNRLAEAHNLDVRTAREYRVKISKSLDKFKKQPGLTNNINGPFLGHTLFRLDSSKGGVVPSRSTSFLLYFSIALAGDSTVMCVYLGEGEDPTTDVSPFFVQLKIKGTSEWIWEGRPKHNKKVGDPMNSSPLR